MPNVSRRTLIRGTSAGALSLGLGAANAPVAAADLPKLPAGFVSRFVDTGALRQHVVVGGDGPPLLLVHGWPQTLYAWRLTMPALAKKFRVIAVDQRGMGLTSKPKTGYDTGTLANDMVALMDALGHQRFAMVGHDTGMSIGYAVATDHPDRLDRLVVAEAIIPGLTESPPLLLPSKANERLSHFGFNRLPAEVNERLVRGREDVYFGAKFAGSAVRKLPDYAVRYYIRTLARDPEALRGSFEWYRALDETIAQNERRKTRLLTLPVLAVGGAGSAGEGVANTMKLGASDVHSVVVPNCGHWVPEEAPVELVAALTAFLL
ncbi:alpha/beta hydrolase [Kibdelosporangium philippinense]|uniref:Alpha/beta hydrolase n=1 Tax=Kibdelosporangium philippinense TaxID=211113 RepID=A0ABS8ZRH0_9PSEU|nr:alpha/beta hydrolase [Kibdelosporangium philippinense]MCE7010247.1 alpha/beta hydrolase [Kibdelosporangium philippinense]